MIIVDYEAVVSGPSSVSPLPGRGDDVSSVERVVDLLIVVSDVVVCGRAAVYKRPNIY